MVEAKDHQQRAMEGGLQFYSHLTLMEHVRIFESSQRFAGRGLIGMSSAATWIQLETIILSEVSQKEKDLMISLTCGI